MIKLILLLFLTAYLQSSTINNLSKKSIQAKLNIVNGYAAECVMDYFYTNSKWTKIEGEIGRNGLDGLYIKKKKGIIHDVLVAESKWNTSKLGKSGKDKLTKQMSQKWVLRSLRKLKKFGSIKDYETIKRFVEYNQYRARLFKLLPIGNHSIQIKLYKIKNKGSNAYDIFPERDLNPIALSAPKNSFEKNILQAYNQCRSKGLNKYLEDLTDKQITTLLKDNYIKADDIIRLRK
jgi:hypothetical protein